MSTIIYKPFEKENIKITYVRLLSANSTNYINNVKLVKGRICLRLTGRKSAKTTIN